MLSLKLLPIVFYLFLYLMHPWHLFEFRIDFRASSESTATEEIFKVYDENAKYAIELFSKKYRIEPTAEILDRLEKVHPLVMKLN